MIDTKRLRVVIPVFNDWESLAFLLSELDSLACDLPVDLWVTVVDDGSTQSSDCLSTVCAGLRTLAAVDLVRLAANVGHQRAIAIGLCLAVEHASDDAVLIMDSDGEDAPSAIPALLERTVGRCDFCVVAARRKRSENLQFRASYLIYKHLFKWITGSRIGFGNFSLLSAGYARRLVMLPDLWNNLAAALLRSRLPMDEVPIDRGKRYAGKSKMNFTSLIVHGFSAISVYADTIFVRLLMASVVLVVLTVLSVATVVLLRLFAPAHATPGWATTVTFGMTIIVLQVTFTTLSSLLALLNGRVQRSLLPLVDYKPYVREIESVYRLAPPRREAFADLHYEHA